MGGNALRVCRVCGIEADSLEECSALFRKVSQAKHGYDAICKECHNRAAKENYKHKKSQMKHQARVRYGISLEEYYSRLGKECELCGKEAPLCYDHDHTTGKFRGTLCRSCNAAIGHLGDNLEGLQRAIRYLEKAQGVTIVTVVDIVEMV